VVAELSEVLTILEKRTVHLTCPLAAVGWEHQCRCQCASTDDILTARSVCWEMKQKAFTQKGVFRDERNSDIFL
jgi:hypothetical protein